MGRKEEERDEGEEGGGRRTGKRGKEGKMRKEEKKEEEEERTGVRRRAMSWSDEEEDVGKETNKQVCRMTNYEKKQLA